MHDKYKQFVKSHLRHLRALHKSNFQYPLTTKMQRSCTGTSEATEEPDFDGPCAATSLFAPHCGLRVSQSMANPRIKAVFFDFMGTCLDWHSGTIKVLPQSIAESERSKLALEWRHDYFDANTARLAANEPPEDIDITLRKTLDALLGKHPAHKSLFDDQTKHRCIAAWHSMPAWPDVPQAIEQLKAAGYEVFVFANGTTRLQLDLCKSSGLIFNMLFSSELLGVYKPAPESYRKTLQLVKVKPEDCVMVAAHRNDVRGGKKAGMKTVYIHRWTDDIEEDMEIIKGENNFFLKDMTNLTAVIGQL